MQRKKLSLITKSIMAFISLVLKFNMVWNIYIRRNGIGDSQSGITSFFSKVLQQNTYHFTIQQKCLPSGENACLSTKILPVPQENKIKNNDMPNRVITHT